MLANLLLEVGSETAHVGGVFDADYDENNAFLQCGSNFGLFRNYRFSMFYHQIQKQGIFHPTKNQYFLPDQYVLLGDATFHYFNKNHLYPKLLLFDLMSKMLTIYHLD